MSPYRWLKDTHTSQPTLARLLGVSTRALTRYLQSERPWPLAIAAKLISLSRGRITVKDLARATAARKRREVLSCAATT